MQSRDFCFWLQGFFELGRSDQITAEQAAVIRRHLDMVFVHETSLRERPVEPVPRPVPPAPEPAPAPRPIREEPHPSPYPLPNPPMC
jgi:hypothetical protein